MLIQPRRKHDSTDFLRIAFLAVALLLFASSAFALMCAAPGSSGPVTISGIVNSYYPGSASVSAGASSVPVGTLDVRGASTAIAAGDLLLVIQIQDASINYSNSSSYGGSSPGQGYTQLNSAGLYEYVAASGAVSGGRVPLAAPLTNSYHSASASSTQGQRTFQVIRVPQYSSATIGATVTAPYWNGATGGIVAFDVAGKLTWGGSPSIEVTGLGFRGGAAQYANANATGVVLANTDYLNPQGGGVLGIWGTIGSVPNGAKGEGIAGTPIIVFQATTPSLGNPAGGFAGTVVNTGGVDGSTGGYPGGSFARGAPGNAAGGGTDGNPQGTYVGANGADTSFNDQNTGGGGGGNYGAGGTGGFGWTPDIPPGSQTGGFGGGSFPSSPSMLIFGGGGGAGSNNNGTNDATPTGIMSSGGAGGGMVFVRAASVAGSGIINANGANGNISATPPSTPTGNGIKNDASGGGGAGGSVLLFIDNGGAATGATINTQGGAGGNNAPSTGETVRCNHGPGGGGSGGYAVVSGSTTINYPGGSNGLTCTSNTSPAQYGATTSPGGASLVNLGAAQITGFTASPECYPRLTVTKATSTPNVNQGGVVSYTITVTNAAGYGLATGVTVSDTLPSSPNFGFAATTSVVLAGGATRTLPTVNPAPGATSPSWGTFSIPGGASVAVTFTVNVAATTPLATYQNPASVTYSDPTATSLGQTITPGGSYAGSGVGTVPGSNYNPLSSTAEDVTVQSPATFSKSFSPTSIAIGGTTVLTVTVTNNAPIALTGASFTDSYPAGLVNAASPPASTTCAGGSVAAAPGGTSFTLSGASIPASGSCQVQVTVSAPVSGPFTNSIAAGSLSDAQNISNTAAGSGTLLARPTIVKSFSPIAVNTNTNDTLTFAISNPNAVSLTGLAFTDSYPSGLVNATPLTTGGTCTGVTLSAGTVAGGGLFNVTSAIVPSGGCTVTVLVRSASTGNYPNSTSGATSTQTPDVGLPSPSAALGVGIVGISKSFAPAQIMSGGTSTVTLTLTNPGGVAQSGGNFTDTLVNMQTSSSPALTTTCNSIAPATLGAGLTSLSFTNIGMTGSSLNSCTVSFQVTSSQTGSIPNTTSGVSTALLPTGPPSNTANLVVLQKPTIAKAFSPAYINPGGSSTLTFTVTNPDSIPLTGVNFTDSYPANLANATPLNIGGTCSGVAVSGTTVAGGGVFNVTSGTVPALSSCTITVSVSSSVLGTYNNQASGVAASESGTAGSASNTATLNVVTAPAITGKSFSPSTIAQNATSTVTFTLSNSNGIPASNVNFTDSLVNMTVAGTALGGSCAGTTSSPPLLVGATSLNLTVPSIPAGGSCTVTVPLTSNVAGANTNQTSGATSTESPVAGAASPVATLNVLRPPQLAKNFAPGQISVGGTTTLTFTVTNLNAANALTNVKFSDPLSNMTLASSSFSKTCANAVTFSPALSVGGTAINPTIATLNANESCTISVTVSSGTISPAAGYLNTTSGATSTETAIAGAGASGSLDVLGPATVAKVFNPSTVQSGGTSTIVFTLTNPNNLAVTGASFSDSFPAGMTTTAAAQTFTDGGATRGSCTGTIPNNKVAGATTSVSFAGINIPANGSCTVWVDVTAATAGSYINNVSGVTTSQVPSAGPGASATLSVLAAPTVRKAFSPSNIVTGGTSTLTITLTNPNAIALSGVAISDSYPANMVNANTAVTNTCGGTATASPSTTNPGTLTLTGGSLAAGASCTLTVTVSATAAVNTALTNTTGGATSTQTPTPGPTGSDILNVAVTSTLVLTKAFDQPYIQAGAAGLDMIFTITNNSGSNATRVRFSATDTMPTTGGAQMVLNTAGAACYLSAASPAGGCTSNGSSVAGPPGTGATITNTLGSTTTLNFQNASTGLQVNAGAVCTVDCPVTIPSGTTGGIYTNTAATLTSTSGQTSAFGDTASVVALKAPGITKAFAPTTIGSGGVSTITFTLSNASNAMALSNATFTDTLSNMSVSGAQNAGGTCGGASGNSFSNGQTGAITLTGLTLPAAGSCTVTLNVTSTNIGANANSTSGVTTAQTPTAGTGATAVNLTVVGTTMAKAFSPASVLTGQPSTLTFTITNGAGNPAQTGLAFTETLPTTPGNLVVANPANISTTCGSGTVTGGSGSGVVSLSGGSMTLGQTSCTVKLDVVAATAGTYTNAPANVTGTSAGLTYSGSPTLAVTSNPVLTKAFAPATIGLGGTSVLTFSIANAGAGLGFTDTFPTGVVIAGTPGVTTSNCGAPTVVANAASGSITVSGATVGAATCTVAVNVTAASAGIYANTNAGNITGLTGYLTANTLTSTLTAVGTTLTKGFSPTTQQLTSSSVLTFTIANGAGNPAQSGLGFTDTLPAGLAIYSTVGLSNSCGGAVTAVANTNVISLAGGTLAAGTASCTISVNTIAASAGVYTNSNAANISGVTSNLNSSGVNASVTYLAQAGISKAFAPPSITSNGPSTITFSLTNANSITLTGATFSDALPASLSISANQNAGGSCGGAAGNSFTSGQTGTLGFTNLSIPPGGCTVTVAVTSNVPGTYNNTTTGVTTAQTALGSPSNTAQLTVIAAAPTIAKAFGTTPIQTGGTSTVTFTLANSNGINLTGAGFGDTMANMAISGAQSAGGTCTGASGNSFANGQTVLSFSGLTIPSNGSCTVSVLVTSSSVGSNANQATGVSSSQAATGSASNIANLVVYGKPTLSKAFGAANIASGGGTTLTLTLGNPAANPGAITTVQVNDSFPAGLTLQDTTFVFTPAACGTVTKISGGSSAAGDNNIQFTAASISAGATCQVAVDVTSSTAGPITNTTTAPAATGPVALTGTAASANLNVYTLPTVTKVFTSNNISYGGTSTMTITVTNPAANPGNLTGVSISDTYGGTLANFAVGAVACSGAGSATLTGGTALGTTVGFNAGTIVPGGTCTITQVVTATSSTNNSTTAPTATGPISLTGVAAGPVTLTVTPVVPTVSKAFAVPNLASGGNTNLTVTIGNANVGAISLISAFTDSFPAGMTINTAGNTGTCPGVTATAGAGSFSIGNGTAIPAGGCTVIVNVTSASAGSSTNTIAIGALQTVAGNNAVAASATLNIYAPPTVAKVFTPASISYGGTSSMTITVTNPAANPGNLTGVSIGDTYAGTLVNNALGSVVCSGAGSATLTGGANGGTTTGFNAGTIVPGGTCTVTQSVSATATLTNSTTAPTATGPVALTGTLAGPVTLTVVPIAPTVTKSFAAGSIASGGNTNLTVTIGNSNAGAITLSTLFTDSFPGGMTINTAGNSGTCTGVTATAAAGSFTIASGTSIPAGGCTVIVNVKSSTAGAAVNTIAAGALQTTAGNNAALASATLNVYAPPTVTKVFTPASISYGGTSSMTITVTNPAANPGNLTGVSIGDTYAGTLINNALGSVVCSGAGSATLSGGANGGTTVGFNAGTIVPGGTCTVTQSVSATATLTNSTTAPTATGPVALTGTLAGPVTLTVVPIAPTVTKSFAAGSIASGGNTNLTVTIGNSNAGAITLSSLFTDSFPGGMTINTAGNSGTCTGVTATAAAGSFTIASGTSIPAGGCTVIVNVKSSTAGAAVNTIAAGALQTTAGNNAALASATLNIYAPPTVAKLFTPASISYGGTSSMTITVTNPAANPGSLTGVSVGDTYAGTLVNNALGSVVCSGAGSATLTGGANGGTTTGFNAGTIVAGGTCTVTQSVSATATLTNSTTAPTATGPVALTGTLAGPVTLTVVPVTPTVTKSFAAGSIASGGNTNLTVTIGNSNAGAITLSSLFTDSFPGGMTINTAGNSGSCTGVTATAAAGSFTIASGTSIPAGGCTVIVNVKSSTAGAAVNTIAAGALQTTAGNNAVLASATLNVYAPPTVTKVFTPASISYGGTSSMTITVTNPAANPGSLTGVVIGDTYTGTLVNNALGSVVCSGAGSATLTGGANGGTTVGFNAGSIVPGGTCTVTQSVSATATLTNSTTAPTATGPVALTGTLAGPVTLTVVPIAPTVTKSFAAGSIASGGNTNLTVTIGNSNAGAITLSSLFTDSFPGGMTINTAGNSGTCTGVTATAAAGSFTIASGTSIPAGGCTVIVNVTSSTVGAASNTIAAGALQTSAGNNAALASATVNVYAPPTVTKSFGVASIPVGGSTTLTLTVGNPAANVAALTGVQLDDIFPAGLKLQNASFAFTPGSCGTVTQTTGAASAAGDGNIRFSDASLAPGTTCQVVANVTFSSVGSVTNTTNTPTATGPAALTGSSANASLTVYALPLLSILKSADRANANPGQVVTYTVQIINTGAGVGTSVVLTDAMSPYGSFFLGAGAPFSFTDSSPASGLSMGVPQYSSDNGATWVYSPVSGGGGAPSGYDGNVSNWRIPMSGSIRANGSFTLNYQVKVK